jgi:hypothetical protein
MNPKSYGRVRIPRAAPSNHSDRRRWWVTLEDLEHPLSEEAQALVSAILLEAKLETI